MIRHLCDAYTLQSPTIARKGYETLYSPRVLVLLRATGLSVTIGALCLFVR